MQAKWTPIDCIALSKAIINIILIYSKMGLVKKKKKKKHVLYMSFAPKINQLAIHFSQK